MVVVMAADASASDVDHVVSVVQEAGGEAFVSRGESRTIIGLSGDIERFAVTLNLAGLPGVADVVRISVAVQAGQQGAPAGALGHPGRGVRSAPTR